MIGVLIASNAVGDGAANNGGDYFAADKAWWFITLLTVGYLISRGLAKAGSVGPLHRRSGGAPPCQRPRRAGQTCVDQILATLSISTRLRRVVGVTASRGRVATSDPP
ncbi:hypothetical protein [Micromonospora sp. DT47]|uniref:hypothetical protein n=1 Tax=Micromonospora sp. DT47 TaxID=3393431 RepID=UPI003CEFB0B4